MPDYNAPVVMKREACSVGDFCNAIHKSIIKDFKNALVWGSSVKHNPQKTGLDHVLADEDVVSILKKI